MTGINSTTVSKIMQPDVLCAEEDWTLAQLAAFLTDKQISGAPVVSDAGNLVGVVSLTDIVRYDSMPEHHAPQNNTHEYYLHNMELQLAEEDLSAYRVEQDSSVCVKDIMTPMIFEVSENASIEEAADTMVKGHIHRLFVTSNNKVSGIITALDMVKVLRHALRESSGAASDA